MNTEYIWWEKTVEYKFILDAVNYCNFDFAAPLAGLQERAGDAIFARGAKVFLVEFKINSTELNSDKAKFRNYLDAEKELSCKDGHHFLVYGKLNEDKTQLICKAQTYFSRTIVNSTEKFAAKLVEAGVNESVFKSYLEIFLRHRLPDGRSSSGAISPNDLKTVFGVSEKGSESMSLAQYCKKAFPHSDPQQAPSNSNPQQPQSKFSSPLPNPYEPPKPPGFSGR